MLITSKKEISKEDYVKLNNSDILTVHDYIMDIANSSTYPPNAYGFYGYGLRKENNKYFAAWEHDSSCD